MPSASITRLQRKFEVRVDPHRRAGLFCREATGKDEAYAIVPWECVLTADKALRSPLIGPTLAMLEANYGFRDEATTLVLFLISERHRGGNASFLRYSPSLGWHSRHSKEPANVARPARRLVGTGPSACEILTSNPFPLLPPCSIAALQAPCFHCCWFQHVSSGTPVCGPDRRGVAVAPVHSGPTDG